MLRHELATLFCLTFCFTFIYVLSFSSFTSVGSYTTLAVRGFTRAGHLECGQCGSLLCVHVARLQFSPATTNTEELYLLVGYLRTSARLRVRLHVAMLHVSPTNWNPLLCHPTEDI